MPLSKEDNTIETTNPSKENIIPQAEPNSLKENLKYKTSSPPGSCRTPKRYVSKLKKERLSDLQYSSFLKECKNDSTKALCVGCYNQLPIQNSEITGVGNHMKTKKHQECLKSIESNACSVSHIILLKTVNPFTLYFFLAEKAY